MVSRIKFMAYFNIMVEGISISKYNLNLKNWLILIWINHLKLSLQGQEKRTIYLYQEDFLVFIETHRKMEMVYG